MSRDAKPVPLKVIDESEDQSESIIRIENQTTTDRHKEDVIIRLTPAKKEIKPHKPFNASAQMDERLWEQQLGIDIPIKTDIDPSNSIENSWENSIKDRRPIPWGWFALVGLLVFGGVVWSLLQLNNENTMISKTHKEVLAAIEKEKKEKADAEALVDRINSTLTRFIQSTEVDELIAHVRHPERVGPLIREYYKERPIFFGVLKSLELLEPMTLDNRGNFWKSGFRFKDDDVRDVVLEILDSGEPKIDWETFVCYQPMEWNEFIVKRPKNAPMDFRVSVSEDSFYSHEFSDFSKWKCFRLSARNSNETIFGYVPINGELAKTILKIIGENNGKSVGLILRLSIPEGIQSQRGVMIDQLVNSRWLYLDSPNTGS